MYHFFISIAITIPVSVKRVTRNPWQSSGTELQFWLKRLPEPGAVPLSPLHSVSLSSALTAMADTRIGWCRLCSFLKTDCVVVYCVSSAWLGSIIVVPIHFTDEVRPIV